MADSSSRPVIGIVGGLGPYAHIELERLLLECAARRLGAAAAEQDYPAWVVSSIPATPDRTAALIEHGRSPLPLLRQSLQRLASAGADFAIIACNTAHAFVEELRRGAPLPIVDMVDAALKSAAGQCSQPARIGLLATTGTCRSLVYHDRLRQFPGLELVTLLDQVGGEALQERLVMESIYGPLVNGQRTGGGLKAGVCSESIRGALREAVRRVVDDGAEVVICGCTEIPLGLGRESVDGTALVDPMEAVALRAIAMVYGEADWPPAVA